MTSLEFQHHVVKLQDHLRGFAQSLTSNWEDAKDLTQETIYKAYKYRDKFQDHTNLKAWLYTIMKNTFINDYRRKRKANMIFDDTKELYFLNIGKSSGEASPSSTLSEKEITKAINSLNDDYKIPFQRHLDGFKYKEIAEELSLPIGTVKSRIFLARKKLMDKLADYKID